MFKVFKYLFLINLYKKAKKSFVMLFVYVISLMLISFIMNDLISVATGITVYLFLLVKWIIIFFLLILISFSVMKILNVARNPFEKKESVVKKDSKKNRIIEKEKLSTKSDLILQKYMKD